MTRDLVEHLEAHLGTMVGGWGNQGDIPVTMFPNQPRPGIVTYSTLGLSKKPLPLPGGRTVRQELVVSVDASYDPKIVASFLITFADYIRKQDRALLRGDVVGPSEPLIPGVKARAVYAAIPVFFSDEFATFRGSEPPTVFVWLIPLPAEDAEYVKATGWESFEDRLEKADINFWNLDRPALDRPRDIPNCDR